MEFVFWQNIISIHQSAFLSALSKKFSVDLIVEQEIEEKRKGDGWSVPKLAGVKTIISPSDEMIVDILYNKKNAIHIFCAISAFPLIYKAIKIAIRNHNKIIVYMEPYNFTGIKGIIRHYKYKYLLNKYGNKIDALLPTGELGIRVYKKLNFPQQKMFQWGYFTENVSLKEYSINRNKVNLLFIGSIDKRKNIIDLVKVCKREEGSYNKLTIIGSGPLEREVQNLISNNLNIEFIGSLPNQQIKNIMQEHDILILPSIFDGWGAVVNEALQCGMEVLASENCGSSILLDGQDRGEIFYFEKGENDMSTIIKKWIKKGVPTIEKKQKIAYWAKSHISGETAADYFISICNYVYNSGEKPIAPWMK